MNKVISRVIERKDVIISKTMEYENICNSCIKDEIVSLQSMGVIEETNRYSELFDFFNENFNDDEIMVIQSIMYFGRECYCHDNYNCGNSVDEIVLNWMRRLFFSFGKQIQKDIEIHQMVEKGLKIGTYFKCGFENLI